MIHVRITSPSASWLSLARWSSDRCTNNVLSVRRLADSQLYAVDGGRYHCVALLYECAAL